MVAGLPNAAKISARSPVSIEALFQREPVFEVTGSGVRNPSGIPTGASVLSGAR